MMMIAVVGLASDVGHQEWMTIRVGPKGDRLSYSTWDLVYMYVPTTTMNVRRELHLSPTKLLFSSLLVLPKCLYKAKKREVIIVYECRIRCPKNNEGCLNMSERKRIICPLHVKKIVQGPANLSKRSKVRD